MWHRDDRSGEAGFALVLTLIVILALSLLTEVMTRWVSSALDHALAHREEAEAKRQMAETDAVAMYLLATRTLSMRGLELLMGEQLRPKPATSRTCRSSRSRRWRSRRSLLQSGTA